MAAGETARKAGNLAQARACYLSALKSAETFGDQDPRLTATIRELADVYLKNHELAKAESLYRRELKILGAIGEYYPDVAHDFCSLGNIYAARSNYEEADKWYRQALALLEKYRNANNAVRCRLYYDLGTTSSKLRKFEEADSFYDRLIALRRETDPNSPEAPNDFEAKAENCLEQGKYQEAERAYLNALPFEKSASAKSPRTALLIARLGLRAPEVIAIQLDDIHWRAGEIIVRGC